MIIAPKSPPPDFDTSRYLQMSVCIQEEILLSRLILGLG